MKRMKRRTFIKTAAGAAVVPVVGCSQMSGGHVKAPQGTMPDRVLGKTGIRVSRLGFGSHLNEKLKKNPALRDRMIKQGYESGINIFDVYDHSNYKQFAPMSKSVRDFRKDIHISLCIVRKTSEVQNEIDSTLATFKTDYIDLYRLYDVDDDRVRIMERNRDAGNIRAIGVVSHSADDLLGYVERYRDTLDYIMLIYNFHHNMGRPKGGAGYEWNSYTALIPRCRELNLGIIGIKPMGSDDMIALASKKGLLKSDSRSITPAMLRYVFDAPEIHTTIPAMNSMDEVMSNLAVAYQPSITAEERERLARLSRDADPLRGSYLRPHYRWLENWHSPELV